jgi:hypothetical protein
MKLLLVTTRQDRSRDRLVEEAGKAGFDLSLIYYEGLGHDELKGMDPDDYDYAILRDPYNTGHDYSGILRRLLEVLAPERVLDSEVYRKNPEYEDKLFQHGLLKDIMAMPGCWHFRKAREVDVQAFPVIVKKRISSRGRQLYVIKSEEDLQRFLGSNDPDGFLFEEFIDIAKDVRVLLIGHGIVGAVERRIREKDSDGLTGIGVKVTNTFEVPEDIRRKVVEVSKSIGSDICGIDFVIDRSGKAFLIECNVSPQFASFERISRINVAARLMDFIKESSEKA